MDEHMAYQKNCSYKSLQETTISKNLSFYFVFATFRWKAILYKLGERPLSGDDTNLENARPASHFHYV